MRRKKGETERIGSNKERRKEKRLKQLLSERRIEKIKREMRWKKGETERIGSNKERRKEKKLKQLLSDYE